MILNEYTEPFVESYMPLLLNDSCSINIINYDIYGVNYEMELLVCLDGYSTHGVLKKLKCEHL